jgi:hypothetical protein
MTSFFEEDGKLFLQQQFSKELNINYPYLWQTTYQNGIGFTCGYDPRHKRLIVTKIDYLPKYKLSLETNTVKDANTIYFDINNSNFYSYRGNVRSKIELQDETYFENKS